MDNRSEEQEVRSLWTRMKAFLFSRNVLVFLLSVLLASCLWLLVSLNKNYEASLAFPVRYDNLAADLECTMDLPETIEVKIKDKGLSLARELGRQQDTLVLDLSEYNLQADRKVTLNTARVFEKRIHDLLPPTTVVLDYYPTTITLEQVQLESKRVPVRARTHLEYAKQYYASDSLTITPDSVSLFGHRKALDTVRCVYTSLIEEKNIKDTLQWRAALQTPKHTKARPGYVLVTAPVEFFTEDSRNVPIHVSNVPKSVEVKLLPAEVNVTYLVGISRFKEVNANEFSIQIEYEELLRSNTNRHTVQLKEAPDYVRNPKIAQNEIQWVIQVTE